MMLSRNLYDISKKFILDLLGNLDKLEIKTNTPVCISVVVKYVT